MKMSTAEVLAEECVRAYDNAVRIEAEQCLVHRDFLLACAGELKTGHAKTVVLEKLEALERQRREVRTL